MRVESDSRLPAVKIIEPRVFNDSRGRFSELYSAERYSAEGIAAPDFVQDNVSVSQAGVLRGMHYQLGPGQAKLVCVVGGRILDVAVDLRQGSSTFGDWTAVELAAGTARQLLIPVGFAHGFFVYEPAIVIYKCSDRYQPELERGVRWDDPQLDIAWPTDTPHLSARDAALPLLSELGPTDLMSVVAAPECG